MQNLELILTIVGLVVVLAAALLAGPENRWTLAAVTATLVGVVHGLIFWLVRRRQRQMREQALRDVRIMLQDVVKNQLTIIQANVYMATRAPDTERYIGQINDTVGEISLALDNISAEALTTWQAKYPADRVRAMQARR
jgi:type II secretory pathway component PulM